MSAPTSLLRSLALVQRMGNEREPGVRDKGSSRLPAGRSKRRVERTPALDGILMKADVRSATMGLIEDNGQQE